LISLLEKHDEAMGTFEAKSGLRLQYLEAEKEKLLASTQLARERLRAADRAVSTAVKDCIHAHSRVGSARVFWKADEQVNMPFFR
jgi:hypothetical protein